MNNKALILIDYINDIADEKGKHPTCAQGVKEGNITNKCNKILEKARKDNLLVIWIKVAFDKGYLEVSPESVIFTQAKNNSALQKGEWGTELIEGLNYKDGETIIFKNRINPFHATNLDLVLRANKITGLYIGGVSTEFAVEAIVRDAHDRDYKSIVIEDICAAATKEGHNEAIKFISKIATVINSEEFLQK